MLNFNEAKKIIIEIINSSESPEDIVLVGGQSIEFWRHHFKIKSKFDYLTRDIDFFAESSVAELNFQAMSHKKYAEIYIPDMDDPTPSSAKMTFEEGDQKIEIDYMRQITGLSGDEIESYSRLIKIDGDVIKVLHPILCMESKIINLACHPAKRKAEGIEQARLSIKIVNSYLSELIDQGKTKETYAAIERIARLSKREPSKFSHYNYVLDTLAAIPIDRYPASEFKDIRYPQIVNDISLSRAKFSVLMDVRKELYDIDSMRYRP